jgi:hypothetical protein
MVQRQKFIQAIGEAVIPLFGFFLFDWGLYFILLYYFIDLFATEIMVNIKMNKIINFKYKGYYRRPWYFMNRFILFIFIIATVLMAHLVMTYIDKDINFYDEIIAFLFYEEVGIPIAQGYILLPLIIFGNYQQYKMFFLWPAKHQVLEVKQVFNNRIKVLSIALIGSLIALVIAYFTNVPEVIYLLITIGVKFYIDFKMRN